MEQIDESQLKLEIGKVAMKITGSVILVYCFQSFSEPLSKHQIRHFLLF